MDCLGASIVWVYKNMLGSLAQLSQFIEWVSAASELLVGQRSCFYRLISVLALSCDEKLESVNKRFQVEQKMSESGEFKEESESKEKNCFLNF